MHEKLEIIEAIKERVPVVIADLDTYLIVRMKNVHKEYETGGGNLTVATMLFNTINFLAKISYFTDKPEEFTESDNGKIKVNETNAFKHFAHELSSNHILVFPDLSDAELSKIWNGFRNFLTHRLTVETGKSVIHFEFPEEKGSTLEEVKQNLADTPFIDKKQSGYQLYPDVLIAKMTEISEYVVTKLISSDDHSKDYTKLHRSVV